MRKTIDVPISKRTENPIAIASSPNPEMGAWDIAIFIGNFKSKKEADEVAHKIAGLLREVVGAEMHRSQ